MADPGTEVFGLASKVLGFLERFALQSGWQGGGALQAVFIKKVLLNGMAYGYMAPSWAGGEGGPDPIMLTKSNVR